MASIDSFSDDALACMEAATLDPVLGQNKFLSGIQRSSRWRLERSIDSPDLPMLTRCVSAFAPIDIDEDIEFRIRTSWQDGWEIISSLGFQQSRETSIVLL